MKNNNNELIDYMINDFKSGIKHGVLVANLTYELAQMCGLSKDEAYELKIAAMVQFQKVFRFQVKVLEVPFFQYSHFYFQQTPQVQNFV